MKNIVKTGTYYPLGATIQNHGVNFALYSRHATGVELLLFDNPEDAEPFKVVRMENRTRLVWHCFVEGIGAGQLYAYRVKGPYWPSAGLRFNYNRLLVDPYAKAITGKYAPTACHLGYLPNSPLLDRSFNDRDNAGDAPKCVVIDNAFDWQGDKNPHIPMQNMIIYEVHLKGFTAHPSSNVAKPGTYHGVIEKIPYLKKLGITSVEFLPLHHCQDENFLIKKGLSNYWGYSTLGYFAPDSRFSSGREIGCQVTEFKEMVRAMHAAGLEIILDVVYNHTCEGNEQGATLSFRGIDNPTYYILAQDKSKYIDYTGCGNSMNVGDPHVIKLIMDSLRYWVEVMHVDGFRFDLASEMGRQNGPFSKGASFFTAIHQDPILSRVKLIAEPWDIAWDSYQVGNFPIDWAEWNGKYRDCVRKFVKGDPGLLAEMGYRLTGSSDLYGDDGRNLDHSINFITCHDGFPLNDLVSYEKKHNEDNQENNRDGSDGNFSWNCGVEGETDNPRIRKLRKKMAKNFLTILMLSQGVPMINGGDEFLRSQGGNNNTYCQDAPFNYFNWADLKKNKHFLDFTTKLIAFRKRHTHFHQSTYFTGKNSGQSSLGDINWYDENLNTPAWQNPAAQSLAFLIKGNDFLDDFGESGADLMAILNASPKPKTFRLPPSREKKQWYRVIDTALPAGQDILEEPDLYRLEHQDAYQVIARSVVVLKRKL